MKVLLSIIFFGFVFGGIPTNTIFSMELSVLKSQNQDDPSCVTSKCHASMGKEAFVHGPVADGDCESCHELLPNEKHEFKPIKNIGELCYSCHDSKATESIVHKPVMQGKCTTCHDPHQSNYPFQIKESPISKICVTCHNKNMFEKKFVHGPTAAGDCVICHTPHTSNNPNLLVQTGSKLCFGCHTEMKDDLAAAKKVHKPARNNCTDCHSPHSTDTKYMLKNQIPNLCFNCHNDIEKHAEKSLVKHEALTIKKKCLNCHSPHGAEYSMQLTAQPMILCLNCHDRTMTTKNGEKLRNMKLLLEKNKDWHGPIRNKSCTGCHDVHGSDFFRILVKHYPAKFYAAFTESQYALCFNCHQPTLAEVAETTTLTGFRNGDRSLHYLHVNRKRGRTCRACHQTHASNLPFHIRAAVPFGKWMLPINYTKTKTGGKCAPGCHLPKQYSRTIISSKKK
ncbi:doubled CXXCH motif [bacterium BMS3Abin04]|nr:doubled CXXCH motif [bacterium BMS3Abin04]